MSSHACPVNTAVTPSGGDCMTTDPVTGMVYYYFLYYNSKCVSACMWIYKLFCKNFDGAIFMQLTNRTFSRPILLYKDGNKKLDIAHKIHSLDEIILSLYDDTVLQNGKHTWTHTCIHAQKELIY